MTAMLVLPAMCAVAGLLTAGTLRSTALHCGYLCCCAWEGSPRLGGSVVGVAAKQGLVSGLTGLHSHTAHGNVV